MSRPTIKTWLQHLPQKRPEHVVIIGAGIAGATTAHALAHRGVACTVLEAGDIASGASGNHQGLLYAKITASDTPQNQLLQLALPFALTHLQQYFPKASFWDSCGLLQLAFNETEYMRQQRLLCVHSTDAVAWQQTEESQNSLWREQEGLWWPQGAWVSPPLWVQALLQTSGITVHTQQRVQSLQRHNQHWHIHTQNQIFQADAVVVCAGDGSDVFAQTHALQLRRIRGQVAYVQAHADCALTHAITAQHYLAPAFENRHTFGASFVFNDSDASFRVAEHQHNLEGLHQIYPALAKLAKEQSMQGRASIRADSIDHLPIVGPMGDVSAMQKVYAKLSHDKNYVIDKPCPYHENLWLNTAHGTRGMVTAPICAQSIARRICHEDDVLPQTLQDALHPNRLPIRQLIYTNS